MSGHIDFDCDQATAFASVVSPTFFSRLATSSSNFPGPVSGRVTHKMAPAIRQVYDQMLEPKWVIAMGACASSGGMFNNYTILQGVDKIIPVDIHVPGCPPRPEALIEGIVRLHEKIRAGVPPAYEIRGVAE